MRLYAYGVEIVGSVISVDNGPHPILAVIGVVEVNETPPDTVTDTVVLWSIGLVFTKSNIRHG